jgi:predicted permease
VRREHDAELREEFALHVELQTAEKIQSGMTPDEARRSALVSAGGLTAAAESVRERRSVARAESLVADFRHAARSLRMHRGFTSAVILTLALAIGANVTMFTILNAVVLRPLPYPDADGIVALQTSRPEFGPGVDDKTIDEWLRASNSFKWLAVMGGRSATVHLAGGVQTSLWSPVSAGFFEIFGVPPERGRVFSSEEYRDTASVVVISHDYWQTAFGGDTAILGRAVQFDDRRATIVGVMPAAFQPERGVQMWTPTVLRVPSANMTYFYRVVARLRPGITISAARAELTAVTRRFEATRDADWKALTPVVMTFHNSLYGDTRKPLTLLMAAVGVLLLIACLNLANLSLARAVRREREFGLRRALGAESGRLIRYVLIENLLLAVAGAGLGLLIAALSTGMIVRISPAAVANTDAIGVDGRVLGFTLLAAVATALVTGLWPAVRSGRTDERRGLSDRTPRVAGSARERRARWSLVVVELATALVLLCGAGLVAKTFWRVTAIAPGFAPEHLFSVSMDVSPDRYRTEAAMANFFDQVLQRTKQLHGVTEAALTSVPPLSHVMQKETLYGLKETDKPQHYNIVLVGPDYFKAIGAHIIAGRALNSRDGANSEPVAVMTRSAAQQAFGNAPAVGKQLRDYRVVGVVEDVHQENPLEQGNEPVLFRPLAQARSMPFETMMLRVDGEVGPIEHALAGIVASIDAEQTPPHVKSMQTALETQIAPRKFVFALLATFASLAALLAVIGLYGVLSYLAADRTRELGIRATLGADAAMLVREVMRDGVMMVVAATTVGIAVALLASRYVSSLLYKDGPARSCHACDCGRIAGACRSRRLLHPRAPRESRGSDARAAR